MLSDVGFIILSLLYLSLILLLERFNVIPSYNNFGNLGDPFRTSDVLIIMRILFNKIIFFILTFD